MFLLGNEVHAVVVDDLLSDYGTLHVDGEEIAEGDGAVGWFPGRRLVPEFLQHPVHVFLRDVDRSAFDHYCADLAQLHLGLQRDDSLEGHGFQVQDFQLRLHEGADVMVFEDLVQGLRDHEIQGLLDQGDPAHVPFHHRPRGLSGPEPRNLHAADDPPVGAVEEGLLVRGVHGDSECYLSRVVRLPSDFQRLPSRLSEVVRL